MDRFSIFRSTLLGVFKKRFSHFVVISHNVPQPKFCNFLYFVPHVPNCISPNFYALETNFDLEQDEKPKTIVRKFLRQTPTLRVIFGFVYVCFLVVLIGDFWLYFWVLFGSFCVIFGGACA